MTVPTGYFLDTHVLVWLPAGDQRLRAQVVDLLADPDASFAISAVTAWEYADLRQRGRLAAAPRLDAVLESLGGTVMEFPPAAWRRADNLPPIHGDPVDRMLIAHAQETGMTLITYDANIRRYPVATFG